MLAGKVNSNGIQICYGLSVGYSGFESANHPGVHGTSIVQPRIADFYLRFHHHRHPDLRPVEEFGPMKIISRNSEHDERLTVDANGFSYDVAITAESYLPTAVTQHSIGTGARLHVVFLMEKSAQNGTKAEDVKVISGGQITPGVVGVALRLKVHGSDAISDQAGESLVSIAKVTIIRIRLARTAVYSL